MFSQEQLLVGVWHFCAKHWNATV